MTTNNIRIKPKEATAIINSLNSGVVPNLGIQHIVTGRELEVKALTSSLEDVKNGHSMVRLIAGDYGSGKSFMLHLMKTVALKQNFVVSKADFSPENRLFHNNWKSVILCTEIKSNISIKSKVTGDALSLLLDKWIEQIIMEISQCNKMPVNDFKNQEYQMAIKDKITIIINGITESGGYVLSSVLIKYFDAYIDGDTELKNNAIKWLKGEYRSKLDAKAELGVREIINDSNWYDMLKHFTRLFKSIGYVGFLICLDEGGNLYQIEKKNSRQKNYEKLLNMYNDCFQGGIENLFFVIAGDVKFVESDRRGLYSYDALKTRLEANKYETNEYRDLSQPVIKLKPLSDSEIFVLLNKILVVYNQNYGIELSFSHEEITSFIETLLNRPGANKFLTARESIKKFMSILNLLKDNPGIDRKKVFKDVLNSDSFNKKEVVETNIEEM